MAGVKLCYRGPVAKEARQKLGFCQPICQIWYNLCCYFCLLIGRNVTSNCLFLMRPCSYAEMLGICPSFYTISNHRYWFWLDLQPSIVSVSVCCHCWDHVNVHVDLYQSGFGIQKLCSALLLVSFLCICLFDLLDSCFFCWVFFCILFIQQPTLFLEYFATQVQVSFTNPDTVFIPSTSQCLHCGRASPLSSRFRGSVKHSEGDTVLCLHKHKLWEVTAFGFTVRQWHCSHSA